MDDKAWKKVNDKPKAVVRKVDQDLLNAAYFGKLTTTTTNFSN